MARGILPLLFFVAVVSACPIGWKESPDGCHLQTADSADGTQVQEMTATEGAHSDEHPDQPIPEEVVETADSEMTTVASSEEVTEAGSLETGTDDEEVKKHSWDEFDKEEDFEETWAGESAEAGWEETAEETDEGTAEETDEGTAEETDEGASEETDEGTAEETDEGTSEETDEGTSEETDLFEGDLELSDTQNEFLMNIDEDENKKASASLSSRWPKGRIVYELTPQVMRFRGVILRAMKHWEEVTCLKFLDHNDPSARRRAGHSKRVRFVKKRKCSAQVGVQSSGVTEVSLGKPRCQDYGSILHAIGHVIGLWHEQARPDRDKYVRIHYENIKAGKQKHFQKYDTGVIKTYSVPYDTGSIMHSPSTLHSKNGKRTIVARRPSQQSKMGQRKGITTADARIVNLMYRCPATASDRCHIRCHNGGHHNHRCHCVCRFGYFGTRCERRRHHRDQQPCGGVINGLSEGVISLPQDPRFFDLFDSDTAVDAEKCVWTIMAKPDDIIRLRVDEFNVGQPGRCIGSSNVVIDDGSEEKIFCGTKSDIPAEFQFWGGLAKIFVKVAPRVINAIVKEESDVRPSMEFHFSVESSAASEQSDTPQAEGRLRLPSNTNCGGTIHPKGNGVITSPNYPKPYSSNLDCAWLIEAPSSRRIRLVNDVFEVESSPTCEWDYVTISGAFVTSRFCGRAENFPRDLISTGNQLLVRFHTDSSKALKGFKLSYYVV